MLGIIEIILYVLPLCFTRSNASLTSSIPVSRQCNFYCFDMQHRPCFIRVNYLSPNV